MLVVLFGVLLPALRMDLLDGLFAGKLAADRYVSGIDDQVLPLRRGDASMNGQ